MLTTLDAQKNRNLMLIPDIYSLNFSLTDQNYKHENNFLIIEKGRKHLKKVKRF